MLLPWSFSHNGSRRVMLSVEFDMFNNNSCLVIIWCFYGLIDWIFDGVVVLEWIWRGLSSALLAWSDLFWWWFGNIVYLVFDGCWCWWCCVLPLLLLLYERYDSFFYTYSKTIHGRTFLVVIHWCRGRGEGSLQLAWCNSMILFITFIGRRGDVAIMAVWILCGSSLGDSFS